MIKKRILVFFIAVSLLASTLSAMPLNVIADRAYAMDTEDIIEDGADATSEITIDEPADATSDITTKDPTDPTGETVSADDDPDIAERTILMYICGADLESFSGMATYNLEQILNSNFSSSGKIRFLVMTGGSSYYKWWLDKSYLYFPEGMPEEDEISIDYNQIWEAKGADAGDLASKLVLLDADGIMGDGDLAKTSEKELMSDPETLKAFINYGVNKCPAKNYDLILWNHGGGPVDGFAYDEHDPDYKNINLMSFPQIIDAVSDNDVIRNGGSNDGKFDFIDFDACLMNSAELILALEPYTNYYIASAETEPGGGQDYTGWLSLLGETPDMNTFALGTFLVDNYISAYESDAYDADVTLAVVNMKKLMESGFPEALTKLNDILRSQIKTAADGGKYFYYDELESSKGSIRFGEGSYSYIDLGNLVSQLAVAKKEIGLPDPEAPGVYNKLNSYEEVSAQLQNILENSSAIYSRSTDAIRVDAQTYMDKDHMLQYKDLSSSGMSIYFPKLTDIEDTLAYYNAMQYAADALTNEKNKAFLRDYSATMAEYALLVELGKAVSALTDADVPKSEINFEKCYEYWETTFGNDWINYIRNLLGSCADNERETIAWLDELAVQMANDAVSADNVNGEKTTTNGSEIYKVTISNTNKRILEQVKMNIVAELPDAKDYLIQNGFYSGKDEDSSTEFDFRLATIEGKEDISGLDIDIARDSGETILHKIQQWYVQTESVWDFEIPNQQVYALQDANGKNHAAEITFDDSGKATALISYPDPYYLTKYGMSIDKKAALVFEEDKDESSNQYFLSDVYLNYPRDTRPVKVSDLTEELTEVKACYKVLAYGGTIDFHIPTSYESFTVSKENADRIHLVLVNMNMIPDISDTTGDGEAIHRDVVVEDIFDYEMNINTRINDRSGPTPNTNTRPDPKPQGDSTSKSQTEPEKATVKSNSKIKLKKKTAVYTGKNINIGKAKVEGSSGKVTYSYYKDSACKQKVKKHKNAGTYYVKAYVAADDKYQAAVSKAVKLVIKPKAIKPKVKLSKTRYRYNGKRKKPKVTVKWGKKTLKKSRDYTVTYSRGRRKRGTYKVKVKLKGNFKGSKTKKFRIK